MALFTYRALTQGLLEEVLSCSKALEETLTEQGREFMREFHSILAEHEITHWLASGEHPQPDGLAKRMVETMKRAMRKCILDGGSKD